MANLPETPSFTPDIYQIETTDKVLGGPDGVVNLQSKQIADRTAWLKQEVEAAAAIAVSGESKADSALAQVAAAETAMGSAAASAASALLYKNDALAAKALAEQARSDAQAAAADASAAATGAAADRVTAGQRAAEAQASATSAVNAASFVQADRVAAQTARNEAVGAQSAAEAAAVAADADRVAAEAARTGAEAAQAAVYGDLASSAAGKGAELVEYQGATVETALNERLPEIGTYALLRAYSGSVTAFLVRGVANIFDGGFGVFRVDASDTTSLDNGGTVLVDASGRRWKRDFSGAINIIWFGADKRGLIDSVPAIQAAINYASSISGSVLIPDGTFLLDLLTFVDPTGLFAQRGLNVFGLLFAKSNVTIFGNGKNSVLKVAAGQLTKSFNYTADSNSGTYQNHAMPGTKGFQVFAQHPTDASISNFTIRDFVIDMNGYNNKVYPRNAFSNQSQCHALYINQGSNIVSERVRYLDAPGTQVICLWTGTTDCRIENNKFTNCGLLDGTNSYLDDHSTIYSMGQNASIRGNRLTQDVQWTQRGGTPIEVHGSATVVGNYISKYLSMGVVAGYNLSGDFVISRNIGRSITALGYDLYTSGNSSYTLAARIAHNDVELTKVALAADHPAYKYRSFIVSPFTHGESGANEIDIFGNEVKMIGATGWSTDLEDTYNAIFNLRLLSTVRAKGNTFIGFRGPIATLQEQKANASVLTDGNTFVSCGRKHAYETDNAVFNYTNRGNVSYGNKLRTLASKNNTFISCSYATYLSANCVAAGILVCPVTIDVTNDNTDTWIAPVVASADLGTGYGAANWQFSYTCTGFIDATQGLKVLPDNTKEYTKSCYGEIVIRSGSTSVKVPGRFIKMRAVTTWNYYAIKYGITDPIAVEVSPFGAQVGDRLSVFTGSIGQPTDFYCTVAGIPGTWVTVGQVGSRTGTVNPNYVYTPHFVGEEYLDTSIPRWYKSTGLTKTSWVALN